MLQTRFSPPAKWRCCSPGPPSCSPGSPVLLARLPVRLPKACSLHYPFPFFKTTPLGSFCSDFMLQIGFPEFLATGDSVEKSLCVPRGLTLAGAPPVGVGGGMDSGA